MVDYVIVTRHEGLVKWLETRGITGEVISHVFSPEQIRGKAVVGALPLYLAAEAGMLISVVMPNMPPEYRVRDLSPEEMDACGAYMRAYQVREVPVPPLCTTNKVPADGSVQD